MTDEEIKRLSEPIFYKKRKTVVDGFLNIIYKMLRDNIAPATILAYTVKLGYIGKLSTMESYIHLIAKNNFNRKFPLLWAYTFKYPDDIITIKRNEILKYITIKNPKLKKNEKIGEYLNILKHKYPIISVLENAYNEFHKMLMGKEVQQLENFMEKYEDSAIKGFIDGIKQDIAPVKNAISCDESSGFVEGNNNKFKLIKRILYGRANLVNLFKKSYVAFQPKLNRYKLQNLIGANAFN